MVDKREIEKGVHQTHHSILELLAQNFVHTYFSYDPDFVAHASKDFSILPNLGHLFAEVFFPYTFPLLI